LKDEERMDSLRLGFIATYPPRECGIASYTRNLSLALLMRGHVKENVIVAINEAGGNAYSEKNVRCMIEQHDHDSYLDAAAFLNESDIDVVSLQHEYGIFGGEWGDYIIDLCKQLRVPIVTTLHTVLTDPPEKARQVLMQLAEMSAIVVVTIESAAKLLGEQSGLHADRIKVIRHGATIPDRPWDQYAKRQLGLEHRTVLGTVGFMSEGKGIEYAIKALPYLVKEHPDIVYLVIGETHPEVRKHEGEAYREKLVDLAARLGVTAHVKFIDSFLPEDQLSKYVQAMDAYVAPYLGLEQVSSGTLTLALSHGKAIVSTPTIFAREVLAHGRGLLCKVGDERSVADSVDRIITDTRLRRSLEANAFKYGREVGWTKVADEYADAFRLAKHTCRFCEETDTVSQA
jgi:glycosyltransferase involved in cell wall biosynthesis